ncbi:hypothetical protein [Parapedobacter sp.]
MKTKKLNHKHFRYLTKQEFKDPLYATADFCRSVISLAGYRDEIQKIIRVSSTSPQGTKPRKYSNLLFFWKYLVKQIELLYVLAHRETEWTLHSETAYYELRTDHNRGWIYDETLYNGSYLNFDQLKLTEVKNIGIFIRKFFKFKSLRKWHKTMDTILETLFEEDSLSHLAHYADDQSKIFRYLEKLAEAIFLIYVTKAKEYIFKHHVEDFVLQKYLEKEQLHGSELHGSEELPVNKTNMQENPAPDETDDDL